MREKPLPVVVEEKKINNILAGWSILDNIIFPPKNEGKILFQRRLAEIVPKVHFIIQLERSSSKWE